MCILIPPSFMNAIALLSLPLPALVDPLTLMIYGIYSTAVMYAFERYNGRNCVYSLNPVDTVMDRLFVLTL